jgi:hypothetical protein
MSELHSQFSLKAGWVVPRLRDGIDFPLPFTRQQIVLSLGITAVYLVGQLLTGTSTVVAALFCTAILFGLLSVYAGGGLRSAFGCLNAILIAKFLLFGVAIKILVLEPADGTLAAPALTAAVMALGFAGLFVGTMLQAKLFCPQDVSLNRPLNDSMLLSLGIVLFVLSYLGYFASMAASGEGDALRTGGWLGIARAFASLKSFAIVPPMLYLWRMKTRLWMTHPLILGLLVWCGIVGVFSTSKQDAMEPFAFYVLVGFLRYGFRDVRLWSIISVGIMYYTLIVYPYSQYVRFNGGREGTLTERAKITKEIFWRMIADPSFRAETTTKTVSSPAYFDEPSLTPLNRMAMVGESDRLVSATAHQDAFTGWETITWGFKLLTPSFLLPTKPVYEAGNFLGHVVGEVGSGDSTTQVSYGIMANFYNAFGLAGAFLGSALFFGGFYYWIRLFLGDPQWDGLPTITAMWFIWLIATLQHSIVESSVSGMIATLSFPVILLLLWMISRWVSLFLPRDPIPV